MEHSTKTIRLVAATPCILCMALMLVSKQNCFIECKPSVHESYPFFALQKIFQSPKKRTIFLLFLSTNSLVQAVSFHRKRFSRFALDKHWYIMESNFLFKKSALNRSRESKIFYRKTQHKKLTKQIFTFGSTIRISMTCTFCPVEIAINVCFLSIYLVRSSLCRHPHFRHFNSHRMQWFSWTACDFLRPKCLSISNIMSIFLSMEIHALMLRNNIGNGALF